MSEAGYLTFADPWFDGQTYLDGRSFSLLDGPEGISWQADGAALLARRTLAGTHLTQRRYLGATAPNARTTYRFSTSFLAAAQEDVRAVLAAEGRGEVVYFCPFVYACEVFEVASGSTYKLSRPRASDVVPGVTTTTHPHGLVLDGVLTPGAATISGQTVTAAATGTLEVHYCPVFRVIPGPSWTWTSVGRLAFSLELQEVIEV